MSTSSSTQAIIDRLWDRLWAGGIANPLTAIEQISYLIFLKRLSDLAHGTADAPGATRAREGFLDRPGLHWDVLTTFDDETALDVLRRGLIPLLKSVAEGEAFAEAMRDAVFSVPKASLVRDCMTAIESLPLDSEDPDLQGDVYERLLKQLSLSGRNGQFRTPRHVIDAIVELVGVRSGDVFCDPAAGTAGFLVGALRKMRNSDFAPPRDDQFIGFDFDASMIRLATINLVLHGIAEPVVHYQDALSAGFDPPVVDVVLANPPFTGSIDRLDVDPRLELPAARTELLFLERCRQMLKPDGGRAAIIVPEGVLFGSSSAHRAVRERWLSSANVEAVISLPSGVFRPYTNVKTAILLASTPGPTRSVWFCPVASDGFSLDDKRTPMADNELAIMPAAVRAVQAGAVSLVDGASALAERMWSATAEEIASEDWSLSPGTYRPVVEGEATDVDPLDLLDRIERLEAELRAELTEARRLLEQR